MHADSLACCIGMPEREVNESAVHHSQVTLEMDMMVNSPFGERSFPVSAVWKSPISSSMQDTSLW